MKHFTEFVLSWLASGIRLVRINRVSNSRDDPNLICKQRFPLSWILIVLGNPVLKMRRAPVRVLYLRQWIAWEQTVRSLSRGEAIVSGRRLVAERIPGRTLAEYLSNPSDHRLNQRNREISVLSEPLEEYSLVAVAANALREFHQIKLNGDTFLSHGDATIENVLVDAVTGTAAWFDFDLRHDLRIANRIRWADDLRALAFSAAYATQGPVEPLIQALQRAYPEPAVWAAVADQIAEPRFQFDLFHRAQVRRFQTNVPTRTSRKERRRIDIDLVAAIHQWANVLGDRDG